jgi:hypothetical protein
MAAEAYGDGTKAVVGMMVERWRRKAERLDVADAADR